MALDLSLRGGRVIDIGVAQGRSSTRGKSQR